MKRVITLTSWYVIFPHLISLFNDVPNSLLIYTLPDTDELLLDTGNLATGPINSSMGFVVIFRFSFDVSGYSCQDVKFSFDINFSLTL